MNENNILFMAIISHFSQLLVSQLIAFHFPISRFPQANSA